VPRKTLKNYRPALWLHQALAIFFATSTATFAAFGALATGTATDTATEAMSATFLTFRAIFFFFGSSDMASTSRAAADTAGGINGMIHIILSSPPFKDVGKLTTQALRPPRPFQRTFERLFRALIIKNAFRPPFLTFPPELSSKTAYFINTRQATFLFQGQILMASSLKNAMRRKTGKRRLGGTSIARLIYQSRSDRAFAMCARPVVRRDEVRKGQGRKEERRACSSAFATLRTIVGLTTLVASCLCL
jgi:hypothetical protein